MLKVRRLLAIILAAALPVSFLPAAARADGTVYEVGTADELSGALSSIYTGDSAAIKLINTIDYPYSISIDGSNVTFDLNNFNLNVTGDYSTALSVFNNGSVQLLEGGGELNVDGKQVGYGVFAYDGGKAQVTNAASEADFGYGAYANGADSSVEVVQTAEAQGLYSSGVYAEYGGTVTVGSNAIGSGYVSHGAQVYNGGTVTVGGNAKADGAGSVGAYAYNNNGMTSYIKAGSATAGNDQSTGAYADGDGSSVEIEQTAGATGMYSRGATAVNSGTITLRDATANGVRCDGVYADLLGRIDVTGSAAATGDECKGAYSAPGAGMITIGGNTTANGLDCYGVYALGGTVTVTGDATAEGDYGSGGTYGVYAAGGTVIIGGNVTAEGARSYGAFASGTGGSIEVGHIVQAIGEESIGAMAMDSGKVTIDGSVSVSGNYSCGISAALGGTADVSGDITSTGEGSYGVGATDGGVASVNGNIGATGDYSCGTRASSGATVTVGGNVSANAATNGEISYGAYADGGTITIDGIITASIYIILDSNEKFPGDGVRGTVPYEDYLIYSHGSSTVRAKFHVSLTITGATLSSATTGTAYSQAVTVNYTGGGTLTYSATGLPVGLSINAGTGIISGTPANGSDTASPYSVTVAVTDGALTDSKSFSLVVKAAAVAPIINTQPADVAKNIGDKAAFTVDATAPDSGSLTYQWQKSTNGGISWSSATGTGTTSASYTTSALTAANNGNKYRCVVTNTKNGTSADTNSNAATLTVNPAAVAPSINTQPGNVTRNIGQTATFTVVATAADGGILSYQWQKYSGTIWSNINLATNTSYTTSALTVANNGNKYRCVVTNTKNGTTANTNSNAATLTVNPAALSITTATLPAATAGITYGQAVTVNYTGGGTLTYSATGLPDGLSIHTAAGLISGTPVAGSYAASPYNVTVGVTDGTLTDSKTFSLAVLGNSTISPASANFDKNPSAQADVRVSMALNGNTLSSIWNGTLKLNENSDYTVTGAMVTINKTYLATLATGAATLTFNFSAGDPQNLMVTVSDSADTAKPTVVSVMPNGAGASVSGNVVITFSEAMDASAGTVSLNGASLTGGSWSGSQIVYTVAYSGLANGTGYSVGLSGFKDIAGNTMDADSGHGFTTGAWTTVTLQSATADGTANTTTSTRIDLIFNASIAGLTAEDITITNGTGEAVKGALTGSGASWSIALASVTRQGDISVSVSVPAGYIISGSPKTVVVSKAALPAAPAITTTSLPGGTVGTAYNRFLAATGDAPITWSIDNGSLPDGLNLTGGTVSGTPTAAGTFDFTVKASNPAGSGTQALRITVALPDIIKNVPGTVEFNLTNVDLPANVTNVSVGSDTVSPGSGSYMAVQGMVGENQGLVLYDLKLLDQGGNTTEPTGGTIKVKIKIPDGMSGDLHVYWYDSATGTLADMHAAVENGYLVFEANHFSYYAVAQLDAAGPMPTPTPEPTSAGPAAENPGIPGLPDSCTMYAGGHVTWTPGRAGGTWYYDANKVEIKQNADGSYTVTALGSGKAMLHYTVGWADANVLLTIGARPTATPTATPAEPSTETPAPTMAPTETESAAAILAPSASALASPAAVAAEAEVSGSPAVLTQSGQGIWLIWLLVILAGCVVVVVIIVIHRKKIKG